MNVRDPKVCEIKAYLSVRGIDPNLLNSLTDTVPSNIARAGALLRSGNIRDAHLWGIRARSSSYPIKLNEVLHDLLHPLRPNWKAFQDLTAAGRIEIEIAIYNPYSEPAPELIIEPELVKALGEICASVQVSLY